MDDRVVMGKPEDNLACLRGTVNSGAEKKRILSCDPLCNEALHPLDQFGRFHGERRPCGELLGVRNAMKVGETWTEEQGKTGLGVDIHFAFQFACPREGDVAPAGSMVLNKALSLSQKNTTSAVSNHESSWSKDAAVAFIAWKEVGRGLAFAISGSD